MPGPGRGGPDKISGEKIARQKIARQKISRQNIAPPKFPDFIYTENRRAAGTRFYLHKQFARARDRTFLYTKNFLRKFMQNQ